MTTITELVAADLLQHATFFAGCTALDFDDIQCVAAGQLPYLSVEAAMAVMLDLMHALDMAELLARPNAHRLELWSRARPTQGPRAWGAARAAEWRGTARARAVAAVQADQLAASAA